MTRTCCCQQRTLDNGTGFSNSCAGLTKANEHCSELCGRCVAVQLHWAASLLETEPDAELGVLSGDRLTPEQAGRSSLGERVGVAMGVMHRLRHGSTPEAEGIKTTSWVDDPTFRSDPVVPPQELSPSQRKRRRRRRAAQAAKEREQGDA